MILLRRFAALCEKICNPRGGSLSLPGPGSRHEDHNHRVCKMTGPPFLRRLPTWGGVSLIWFLLTVPGVFIRAAHYEEGTTIGLARGAFEDGHWLSPHLYGLRFVERPVLVSWALGGMGALLGELPLWLARLPAVLSILAGALLIARLVREQTDDKSAALFGAACFLASPMILQKIFTAEADTIVSTMLFAALIVWWRGWERERFGVARWLGLGLLLALAALVKGPQPLGYFFLGVGAWLLWRRDWRGFLQLVLLGLVPAAAVGAWYGLVYQPGDFAGWMLQSRLADEPSSNSPLWRMVRVAGFIAVECLPGLLLAVALAVSRSRPRERFDDLASLLWAYASVCTVLLILWPGANGRYAMPAVLAIATLAGLALPRFRSRLVARVAVGATVALLIYGMALNLIAMPLFPDRFRASAARGRGITQVIAAQPQPIYATLGSVNRNTLVYLPASVRLRPIEALTSIPAPSWLLATPSQAQALRAARPDLVLEKRWDVPKENNTALFEIAFRD